MAQTSYPFDAVDTTEAQYSEIFRRLVSSGVWGDSGGNQLKPYADSSGMNVKVPAGYAFVYGFFYYNDSIVTLPIAASASNPRIDTVVLRLNTTANTILLAVVTGTAAASPVPATLANGASNIWEIPLGYVNVPVSASTISAGNVTDARLFASAVFDKWTTETRPTSPRRGDPGFNLTTGVMEYWDGTWKPFMAATITAAMISDQENINAGKINGRKFTVSTTAPASPAINDVWVDRS